MNNFQKENLVNEKTNINININSNQINKKNNWTEILYNIVDNFSDENSFTNNSEESIKPKEEKKEIKAKLEKPIIKAMGLSLNKILMKCWQMKYLIKYIHKLILK